MTTPGYWGEPAWDFLDVVAARYPNFPTQNDKDNYYTFFILLQYVLPCHECSKHFSENLIINPLNEYALSTPATLTNWLINMHNIVNGQTKAPKINPETAMNSIFNKGLLVNNLKWTDNAWKFLHAVTIGYPATPNTLDKEKYRLYFTILQYVLPANDYREAYVEALKVLPLTDNVLSSQTNLFDWANEMHNRINTKFNIPTITSEDRLTNIIQEQEEIINKKKKEINEEIKEAFVSNFSNNNTLLLFALIILIIAVVTALSCSLTLTCER